MATSLEEIGEPVLGAGFSLNIQVPASGLADRTVTRNFKVRVTDVSHYTQSILNPTLWDSEYPLAVLVDQFFKPKSENKVDGILTRVFSETPSAWNESGDRAITYPGVALSSLYAPGDFAFRPAQITLPADVRINRAYFQTNNEGSIPRFKKFKVFDQSGLQTSVITDYTTPSVDEWIAMTAGLTEIVDLCRVTRWRGSIFCRETIWAPAQ
jgi:hypothetical protein